MQASTPEPIPRKRTVKVCHCGHPRTGDHPNKHFQAGPCAVPYCLCKDFKEKRK